MKNKKHIVIVSTVIALALLAGIGVFAVANGNRPAESPAEPTAGAADDAANTNQPGKYQDADGNRYKYDQSGTLVSYSMDTQTYVDHTWDQARAAEANGAMPISLTEEQALEIAEQFARENLNGRFDLVTQDDVFVDNANGSYQFTFYQKLGENGFVNGICCNIQVLQTGVVASCTMQNYEELADFDPAMLDGVTEQTVLDAVFEQVLADYPEASNPQLMRANLEANGARYRLAVHVSVSVPNPGWTRPITLEYTYSLN